MTNLSCCFMLWLLLISCSQGVMSLDQDGYLIYGDFSCSMHSNNPHQGEGMAKMYFNNELLLKYNSTKGKWEGCTPAAVAQVEKLNNPSDLLHSKVTVNTLCLIYAQIFNETLPYQLAEPTVKLKSVKPASSKHPAMLVCSVRDFYPKPIRVTWLKNRQEVTSDLTLIEELSNGDWTYQVHSYLQYTPVAGERITCMVEHISLSQPALYDWEHSSMLNIQSLMIGTCGILLGLVFLAAGIIQYTKKYFAGRVLVPADIPLSNLVMG